MYEFWKEQIMFCMNIDVDCSSGKVGREYGTVKMKGMNAGSVGKVIDKA